jgi:hypothetical protein
MRTLIAFKLNILQLIVIGIIIGLPKLALSHPETLNVGAFKASVTLPKSFAVFVAHYNSNNNNAIGGVAGTAFFVSPNKAITAFHVLQAASFAKYPGFEKVKVWLVHEGRPAIEVHLSNLSEQKDSDMTVINFGDQKPVFANEIYPLAKNFTLEFHDKNLNVVSDGFVANSTGPELARNGSDLVITKVSHLQRIHADGKLMQAANIRLTATDVNLVNASCFQASYEPIVGLSGGPMVVDGQVVAMNSFADPSRKSTWALQLRPLMSRFL